MAFGSREEKLNILVQLKDQASKKLKKFEGRLDKTQSKLESMQPAFRKMALAGSAAFAGIATGAVKTTQAAADAEGAWNKFNTVFAGGADDMRGFVQDLRQEMPSATAEIARMAADLQDLLVPMGIARDEAQGMSKRFLDLTNKVAAFNDVDPSVVMEALRSGIAGMSRPLRQFGIDARKTTLEEKALEEGLLSVGQTFKDLEPEAREQVRIQALLAQSYAQSSDAINGFAANQDSYLRRSQELKASFQDLQVTVGEALMPAMDMLQKRIIPLIQNVAEWAKENDGVVRTLTVLAGGASAAAAAVGGIGLVLPSIIRGMKALATASKAVWASLGPWGLAIAGVVAAVIYFREEIAALANQLGLVDALKEAWDKITEAFENDLKPAVKALKDAFKGLEGPMKALATGIGWLLIETIKTIVEGLTFLVQAISKVVKWVSKAVKWVTTWDEEASFLTKTIKTLVSTMNPLLAALRLFNRLTGEASRSASQTSAQILELDNQFQTGAASTYQFSNNTKDLSDKLGISAQKVNDIAAESLGYKENADAAAASTDELGAGMEEMGDKADETAEKMRALEEEISKSLKDHTKRQKEYKMDLAEEYVKQEEKITDMEKRLREKRQREAEGDLSRREEKEISQLERKIQKEKNALKTMENFEQNHRAQIEEQRRRARLTDFERTVENIKRKRIARLKEFKNKLQEQVNELNALKSQKNQIAAIEAQHTAKVQEEEQKRTSATKEATEEITSSYDQRIRKLRELARQQQRTSSSTGGGGGGSFQHGGIVPGPIGQEVPILAHGQERIIPARHSGSSSSGGGDTSFTVNLNNPVLRDTNEIGNIKREIDRSLRSLLRKHKVTSE